ncbi:hypothetical protein [Succinatimonas hippei]|uniref:hypothetical protein n=1 Tax=Succinatimonas hippei TaxID=626938 RepID=UPI00255CD0AE|nr:hypothetical protein [Succinatimonas hippei]
MEITVKVEDKLVQEVKDARSSLAKLKAAIDKARKAASKWFDPDGLKLSEEAEKKVGDAHLVYDQKIAEITNAVAESILGQKIDVNAEIPETENCQQVKSDSANADAEPNTLRKLAKQQRAEQVKNEEPAEQAENFDFADFSGVKGITGMAKDGQVREYITVNDVDIAPLDKVEAITKQQAEGIFLIPSLAEGFMSLPAGVKRTAIYLRFALIKDVIYESSKREDVAYIRAVKSIIDLPDSDWPQLHQAFEIIGAYSTAASSRALMKVLIDLSQKENAKRILNSICARQFAFVGEPKRAVYSRLSAAIKHENDKLDLPDDLDDEPKENTAKPESAKEEKKEEAKEPAADTGFPAPAEELPEFLDRVKQANTKEEINKLCGDARVATTGSEAKDLVFYGDPFITNKDYALLQQALADREQELKKKEVKDFRFLRRAGDFRSSFAVRIAYDLYRRIKGDKEVKFDHLRDIAGLLSDDKEKTQLLAEINTYARNIGEAKE